MNLTKSFKESNLKLSDISEISHGLSATKVYLGIAYMEDEIRRLATKYLNKLPTHSTTASH